MQQERRITAFSSKVPYLANTKNWYLAGGKRKRWEELLCSSVESGPMNKEGGARLAEFAAQRAGESHVHVVLSDGKQASFLNNLTISQLNCLTIQFKIYSQLRCESRSWLTGIIPDPHPVLVWPLYMTRYHGNLLTVKFDPLATTRWHTLQKSL